MKNILITIALFLSVFWITSTTYAGDASTAQSTAIEVQVTEKMPWMDNCTPIDPLGPEQIANGETYTCEVEPGFASVQKMLAWMIKYFTFIAGIGGVLFLVINGIMYSMWGMDAWMKDEAKKRIQKTLSWLIVLLLSWVILNLIAPWIYK